VEELKENRREADELASEADKAKQRPAAG